MSNRRLSGWRYWLVSLLLTSPAIVPPLAHYAGAGALVPTGFVQGDQPSYMAHAREHFDDGPFSLTYGNPSGADFETPRIYFQPQALVMGLIWRHVLHDPGPVLVLFGLVWAIVCGRIAIALFASLFGLDGPAQWIGLAVMFWGGGVLVLAGALVTGFYSLYGTTMTVQGVFFLDPFAGLWCLNFGRTLIYPNEAYYHALFFTVIVLLLGRRFLYASLAALLLSFSHPWTGIELLSIVLAWLAVEVLVRKDAPPVAFVAGWGLLLAIHLGYYLYVLPLFPEHRSLVTQWTQPWVLPGLSAAAAYVLVAVPALWRIRTREKAREVFAERHNRLFLVWFAVAFALANHEVFIRAHQPLHFTRGYVWLPLFLLGAPVLISWFRVLQSRGRRLAKAAVAALVVLFFVDNASWFTAVANGYLLGQIRLTRDEAQVLRWINEKTRRRTIVVSEDPTIGYLSTVYTPARSWLAHGLNTPDAASREREIGRFFAEGEGIGLEGDEDLIFVFAKSSVNARARESVLAGVRRTRRIADSTENAGFAAFNTVRAGPPQGGR